MISVFCNLLVNSIFSLACGLAVIGFFLWLFRVPIGRARLWLLYFPVLKILFDVARGLPENSILLAGVDPFQLPPKHQLLTAGAGFTKWGPLFNVQFSVQDLRGHEFAASVGDYLAIWLKRDLGSAMVAVLVAAVLSISIARIFRRAWNIIRFERERNRAREGARQLRVIPVGLRRIDVYVSDSHHGSPFTGGLLKPYICLPADAVARLSRPELEGVIAHEVAHTRRFDVATTFLILLLGDVFWFIPGFGWLNRRIDRLREILADEDAVRHLGAQPAHLASALVKLRELAAPAPAVHSAFFRERSVLKTRIELLLAAPTPRLGRWGWRYVWLRVPLMAWMFTSVMTATLGGNHSLVQIAPEPAWMEPILRALKLWGLG